MGRIGLLRQALIYGMEKPKQPSFVDMTEQFSGAKTEYILNFTSNIIKITNDGKTYYFKESKRREKNLKECVLSGVKSFFCEVERNSIFESKVLNHLKIHKNLKKLINLGQKDKKGSNFNRYLLTQDEKWIGLDIVESEEERRIIRLLAFYLYGEINAYIWNFGVKRGRLQTFSANRTLGVTAIAKLIHVEDLLTSAKFVKITLNGIEKYGILSEEAEGSAKVEVSYEERMKNVTPSFVRALNNLNLLDVLTGDNDHRVGNYNVIGEEKYISVKSYDNDGPSCFSLTARVNTKNQVGCSPFLTRKGEINRAHFDREVANALLSIRREDIGVLRTNFTRLQVYGLWKRIKKVQKAIEKTVKQRAEFLLTEGEWTERLAYQDVLAEYGKTYLKSFLTEGYYECGLHQFDRV